MTTTNRCECCDKVAKQYRTRVKDMTIEVCHACRQRIRNGEMLCQDCNLWLPLADVDYGTDPYDSEINEEENWLWQCESCHQRSCDDV